MNESADDVEMGSVVANLWLAYKNLHLPIMSKKTATPASNDDVLVELWQSFIQFCNQRGVVVDQSLKPTSITGFRGDLEVRSKQTTSHSVQESNPALKPKSLNASAYQCTICLKLLYMPTTTACGHSFCLSCLATSLRYQQVCPVCRAVVYSRPSQLAVTTDLARMLEEAFPVESRKRRAQLLGDEAEHCSAETHSSGEAIHQETEQPDSWSGRRRATVQTETVSTESVGVVESIEAKEVDTPAVGHGEQQVSSTNGLTRPSSTNELTRPSSTNELTRPSSTNELTRPSSTNELPRPSSTDEIPRPSMVNEVPQNLENEHLENVTNQNRETENWDLLQGNYSLRSPSGTVYPSHRGGFGEFAPLMGQTDSKRLPKGQEYLSCFIMRGQLLPLQRIDLFMFEFRYIALTSRCLSGSRRFGILCNWRHPKVGVEVEITAFERMPGGRFHVTVLGRRPFRVKRSAWSKEGYRVCQVEYMEFPTLDRGATGHREESVKTAFVQLGAARQALRELLVKEEWISAAGLAGMEQRLGPPPPWYQPDKLSLWYAAYLNPIPGIGVAREIRERMLFLSSHEDRIRLVRDTLEAAIRNAKPSVFWNWWKWLREHRFLKRLLAWSTDDRHSLYIPIILGLVTSLIHYFAPVSTPEE